MCVLAPFRGLSLGLPLAAVICSDADVLPKDSGSFNSHPGAGSVSELNLSSGVVSFERNANA